MIKTVHDCQTLGALQRYLGENLDNVMINGVPKAAYDNLIMLLLLYNVNYVVG